MSAITENRMPRRRPVALQSTITSQTENPRQSLNNSINRLSLASLPNPAPSPALSSNATNLASRRQQFTLQRSPNNAGTMVVVPDASRSTSFANGTSPSYYNSNVHSHPQPTFQTNMNQYSQMSSLSSARSQVSLSQQQQQQQHGHTNNGPVNATNNQTARRTLSNATSSTASSTGGQSATHRQSGIHRSGSSRSMAGSGSSSPTSYVALLRKQKATVWCDRAQYEDPRQLAQQRAEKMRAAVEVVGGVHHGGSGSLGQYGGAGLRVSSGSSSLGGVVVGAGGVRSKIRHGSGRTISAYGGGNLAASAVPPRLSATEVDEADQDVGSSSFSQNSWNGNHQRSGSSRSSLSGRRRASGYALSNLSMTQQQQPHQSLYGHPQPHKPSHHQQQNSVNSSNNNSVYDDEETPVPYNETTRDYFTNTNSTNNNNNNNNYSSNNSSGPVTRTSTNTSNTAGLDPHSSSSHSITNGTRTGLSTGSNASGGGGSSTDRGEQGFGRARQTPARSVSPPPRSEERQRRGPQQARANDADERRRAEDELRRRGSVDERTGTMTGAVRLFIANPDLSD